MASAISSMFTRPPPSHGEFFPTTLDSNLACFFQMVRTNYEQYTRSFVPELKKITVMVFTVSLRMKECVRMFEVGMKSFLTEPGRVTTLSQ